MSRGLRLSIATLLGGLLPALAGCHVAPREGPELPHLDASVRDGGGATKDAGVTDAGPPRCDQGSPCGGGLECARDGVCRAPGSACTTTEGCTAPSICVDHVCGTPPGACTLASEAACGEHHRCSAVGYCEPSLSSDGNLDLECSGDVDCGRGAFCRFGVCGACEDRDCRAPFVCGASGRCQEPSTCQRPSDCWPGNECTGGQCQPSAAGCRRDPANDLPSGAELLSNTASTTPTICGADVDWYRIELAADEGAELIVRSDVAVLRVIADLYTLASAIDGDDLPPSGLVQVSFPGLEVLRVPTSTQARSLALRVLPTDVGGPYLVELRKHANFCAGDELDIYGDESRLRAPTIPRNAVFSLRACPGDVDALNVMLERGDALSARDVLSGSDGLVQLSIADDAGPFAGPKAYTLTTTVPLTPSPPTQSALWTVSTAAGSVPALGQPYQLELSTRFGARISACQGATVVGAGSTSGDLAGARDIGLSTCGLSADGPGPDRVYAITPPRAGAVLHATVRTATRTARFSLAALSDCNEDLSLLSCDAPRPVGTPASLELVAANVSPIYLWVSARTATVSTAFTLDVTWDQSGDYTCRFTSGVTPILASGDLEVDTTAGTNTVEATASACGGDLFAGDGAGPDRFLSLELGAGERAALDLVGPFGGLMWVGTSCNNLEASCVGAAQSRLGSPGRVVLQPTVATSYIIAVDGVSSGDAGRYTVHALVRPACLVDTECMAPARCDEGACVAPPGNDRCDGQPLTLVGGRAVVQASTGAAADSFSSLSCPSGTSGGQDVVYSVDVPAGLSELRARISSASWDPILVVRRGTCPTATAEVACNDDAIAGADLKPDVKVINPAAGRYFIIVDAYSGSGPFTLEITAL